MSSGVSEILRRAIEEHRSGRLGEAGAKYREVFAREPGNGDALHLLGVLETQRGNFGEAEALIREAMKASPRLAGVGQTHSNLAGALKGLGRIAEAILAYREAVRMNPQLVDVHESLGNVLVEAGRGDEAIECFREVVRQWPGRASAYNGLGNALGAMGKLEDAIAAYREAIRLEPTLVQAHSNLGNVFQTAGRFDEAVSVLKRAVEIQPGYVEAWNNLGNAYCNKGKLDEAVAAFGEAIKREPGFAKAHNNLGTAYKDMGRLEEAVGSYRKAIEIDRKYHRAGSNLLYALHFHPEWKPAEILREHRRWNASYAAELTRNAGAHCNGRDPERAVRVGFVSADFREHPVGRFLLPVVAELDASQFAAHFYSDVACADEYTERFKRIGGHWRDVRGQSDERVAELIRRDRIDILFDLTMHMAGNRMLLFGQPAPVQVTYLAYCSTTGLDAMDYRLTDPHLDPPGVGEGIYSERSIRLAETYWCYAPPIGGLGTVALPALGSGIITFGCLNNFSKASGAAQDAWIEVLRSIPQSRLFLHAKEGSHRRAVVERMRGRGVEEKRVTFFGKLPLAEYFGLYNQIDIALDPFPCNGGTTTCDALWMGVPVVALGGESSIGRGGVSVLTNVGMPRLIAGTREEYVEIARALAGGIGELAAIREGLRLRMEGSVLMDGRRFAGNFEAACRLMWREWCLGQ